MEDKRTQQRSTAFGRRLKQYRTGGDGGGLSLRRCNCKAGHFRARTVEEVVDQTNDLECNVTAPAYTDIEERPVLPAEPERFFDAVVIALDLCEHEGLQLLQDLAYSVLEIELGADLADELLCYRSGRSPRSTSGAHEGTR